MLKNKTVVITGANRGIGKAMVECFVQQGAIVYAVSRNDNMKAICDDLTNKYSGQIIVNNFDVKDTDSAKKMFLQVYKSHGSVDVLVNNAGIMNDAMIGMISNDMIRDMFETNVYSVIHLTQLAARFMIKQKSGSIINIASIIGVYGNSGQSVYSATKGAIISFTKSAAKELAAHNIRVNAISPGIIETQLINNVPPEKMEKRLENVLLGRIGKPYDVAQTAVFLASDNASYISGQNISVDGCTII